MKDIRLERRIEALREHLTFMYSCYGTTQEVLEMSCRLDKLIVIKQRMLASSLGVISEAKEGVS